MPPRRNTNSGPGRPAPQPSLSQRLQMVFPYALLVGMFYLMFGGSAKKHAKIATKNIALRTLPPPPPRQPSSFRLPLCSQLPDSKPSPSADEQGCPLEKVCGGAFYANYLADELVQLDVNSHSQPPEVFGRWRDSEGEGRGEEEDGGDPSSRLLPPLPPVATAADCCQACRDHPECNVWVFCADKKYGCGECFPQVSNFDAKQADKSAPASSRFGPFGGCTSDYGSFPFRTCSLKKARDPRRTNPTSYDDFDSWISGALGVAEEAKEEKKKKEDEKKEGRKEKGGGG